MGGLMSGVENSISTNITDMFNHANSVVINDIHKLNDDFYDGYQWIAALDSDTCLACAALDNKIVDKIEDFPDEPPLHHNCRCIIVPVLEGMKDDPSQTALNYKDWFDEQSNEIQLDILGPARYKEYLNGMSVTGFVKDGRIMTLDELGISRMNRKELLKKGLIDLEYTKEYDIDLLPKGDINKPLTIEQKENYKDYLFSQFKDSEGHFRAFRFTNDKIEKWADRVMERLEKLPEKLQHILYANRPRISFQVIGNKRAYFSSDTKMIHMLPELFTLHKQNIDTWFHELGHAIDYKYDWFSSTLKFKDDYRAFIAIQENLRLLNNIDKENKTRFLRGGKMGDVSDLFYGFSNGKWVGDYGHKPSYYKKKGIKEAEGFAHFVSSLQSEHRIYLKEYFPITYKQFIELLDSFDIYTIYRK